MDFKDGEFSRWNPIRWEKNKSVDAFVNDKKPDNAETIVILPVLTPDTVKVMSKKFR